MKQFSVVVALVVLLASSAAAQTAGLCFPGSYCLTSAVLQVFQGSVSIATTTVNMVPPQTTCDLAQPTGPTITFKAARFYFEDPVHSTATVKRYCLTTAGTFLGGLAPTTTTGYTATLVFNDDLGRASLPSPLSVPWFQGAPPVLITPSGVTVIP